MNGIELILIALLSYVVAYKVYGGFITKRLEVNNNKETPSHTMYDGVDYVQAKAPVLLGHHFASIAGA
ncbi:MAG TPA: carbon starvation CstA family protein, partial [Ignavibacteriaceae bacterium]